MKKTWYLTAGLALGLVSLGLATARQAAPVPDLKQPGPAAARDEGKKDEAKEAAPKLAASKITSVTVYPDSALVTREVEVPAGDGLVELVVSPMPAATVNSSLYSEGSEGLRVLTTRFRTRPVKEDTREEVRKLDEEIKKLQLQSEKLQSDTEACRNNTAFLAKLENFATASTTHATEKGKMDSEQTIALAKYLIDGRTERSREMVTLRQQEQVVREQLEFLNRKMRELTAGTSKVEREAVIVVDKGNAAGKVKLNYLVGAASWKPQYKFRAGKTAKDPVGLEYLAAVVQQTGEDWSRVDLTLSTAQPMLNAAPPELRTLAVNVVTPGSKASGAKFESYGRNSAPMTQGGGMGMGGQPVPPQPVVPGAIANPAGEASVDDLNKAVKDLRQRAQVTLNNRMEKEANEVANLAANLDQARDLVVQTEGKNFNGLLSSKTGVRNEGPSVTYHLSNRLSVPSRVDDQIIEVARIELAPDYFYKAVPVLSPHVYRQATLANSSKYVLLPGEATMYAGSDFVGRMNLPLVAVGEEFTVGFGTEPQLQVQRVMLDKTRAMQGGNQILKYDYRILISSYKSEKVKLQVWDRLPHAENESMGVNLIKTTPELCKDPVYTREDRPNNLLRWDLEVEPDAKGEKAQKVQYEFKLELDKNATIGSFQSK